MKKIITLLASGLGLGLIPWAPGTFGTLIGVILAILVPDNIYLVSALCITGIWAANEGEKIFEEHDSPKIVIDEIAGFLIAAYNMQGGYLIAAFILFRFFDILKPFPVKQLQNLPGGLGVMADDIAAGVMTNIILLLFSIYVV
ncbi:MAG TPA: phosphatidylglycerophosphatase A [Desulfobacteria bacterium]|nr:phosphatidylglycerophosphatase A [Desulfobacteria bacterium]